MLVCGHQPNYLPWLGFFHKLAQAERFMLVDTVQYVGRGPFGFMHRNKIRNAEGWQWLSLPIRHKGRREQLIHEAELNNELRWARKHWAAIEYHYRKAPHFDAYAAPFHEIYHQEWTHLAPLASSLIQAIADALEIATPIALASSEGVSGESTHLILNICKHYGASRYLSGVHGRDYLDMALLAREGVEVVFQDFKHPTYPQHQGGDFQPAMCALDALFNLGPDAAALVRAE
ncbi:MAG: WbqC family protein [Planctomycetes bacterium]|nr:WbqC family protein [Planctomycetota bacterium]